MQGAHSFRKAVWDWAVANGVTDSAIQLLYGWEIDATNMHECVQAASRPHCKWYLSTHVHLGQHVFHIWGAIL